MLSKTLLNIIACTKCKGRLEYDKKNNSLVCKKCKLRYTILRGDIPDMMLEHAKKL